HSSPTIGDPILRRPEQAGGSCCHLQRLIERGVSYECDRATAQHGGGQPSVNPERNAQVADVEVEEELQEEREREARKAEAEREARERERDGEARGALQREREGWCREGDADRRRLERRKNRERDAEPGDRRACDFCCRHEEEP